MRLDWLLYNLVLLALFDKESIFFLIRLLFRKSMIAIVPLIVFLSGFVTSMLIPVFARYLAHHFIYFIGGVFVISGFVWAYFIADPISSTGISDDERYDVIGVAVVSFNLIQTIWRKLKEYNLLLFSMYKSKFVLSSMESVVLGF